ncbi:MAG: hypothetical protein INQ03_03905 [Candidatus Heimdallarchaeota archaeon]|nr:hypothetical protein [Candidatus Heimdallarchaeota archaeon]
MKIFACYIFKLDGTCLFDKAFYPMPEAALITAMVSAMQSFIKEISGVYANKVSAGGFVFHIEKIGKITIALVTSDDERPVDKINKIRTVFISKYGQFIEGSFGQIQQFAAFENELQDILGIIHQEERVNPTKQLNSFAFISIKPELQKIAKLIVMKKEGNALDLAKELNDTAFNVNSGLEQLFDLGYVGRYYEGNSYTYFVDR